MQTIIQNSFILQYYPYKNIDQKILELFDNSSVNKTKVNFIKRALNVYLNITSQKLYFIELSSEKFQKIIDDLYLFLSVEYFKLSDETLRTVKQQLQKSIVYVKEQVPALEHYNINTKHSKFNFKIDNKKINYFNGWFVINNNKKQSLFINLIIFHDILGKEKTDLIHKNAQLYISKFELETSKSFLAMLNEFSQFVNTKDLKELKKNINNENYVFELLKDFCFDYFQNSQSKGYCLHNSKRKWNKFIKVFEEIFLDGIILPKLAKDLPQIPNNDKKSFEKRIKISNNNQVKAKLITEIPLNIKDEVALEILFKKIKKDIRITLEWAYSKIEEVEKNYDENLAKKYLGQSVSFIQKEIKIKTESLKKNLLTSYDLDPFLFLLISEHPQITESYLLNLELYNEHGNLIGYQQNDNCSYLIGYKKRRGFELAEQKILLNEKSKKIVEKIISLTKEYRIYLKSQKNDDWRFLFLQGGINGVEPQRYKKSFVPAPSNLKIKEGQARISFVKSISEITEDEAQHFVSNMTMTKLRASIAVQLYLDQNDTKKMAEALGHKKYKPELLSFYLPESILDFFQSRWIRIFQKGIICEAMKNNKNLLKSSKFTSMEELEKFMSLHALKNIPDIKKETSKNLIKEEIYIGINEEILKILCSLEHAVELAKEEVAPKALYWAKFANHLQKEILNNKANIQFVADLEKAKKNIIPELFKEAIYEK